MAGSFCADGFLTLRRQHVVASPYTFAIDVLFFRLIYSTELME